MGICKASARAQNRDMETDSENNEEYHEEKKRKLPIFGERKVRKKIFSYQEYHEEKIRK